MKMEYNLQRQGTGSLDEVVGEIKLSETVLPNSPQKQELYVGFNRWSRYLIAIVGPATIGFNGGVLLSVGLMKQDKVAAIMGAAIFLFPTPWVLCVTPKKYRPMSILATLGASIAAYYLMKNHYLP